MKDDIKYNILMIWAAFFSGDGVHGIFVYGLSFNEFKLGWIYLIVSVLCLFLINYSGKRLSNLVKG